SVYKESRIWLDERGLDKALLFSLDKYGRDNFLKGSKFNLTLEDYYKMNFDYAVEDSPLAFKFFNHLPNLKVLVYDRPWNQGCDFPGKNFFRCTDWKSIAEKVIL
ncbi:MAG: 2-dehydropantoate 2-reductase, partial [Treponema sp.]|nr:2-dehydropantoate 2-reductase [Treponema sp.]